ncbi:hypothetical protein BH18ACT13_BH18ACT13_20130 [soil metagenome]
MKLSVLTVTLGVIGVLALAIPGGAPAGYPASAQRLLVTTETVFERQTVLVDERGRPHGLLDAAVGDNGGLAVSSRGTSFAYVQTLGFDLPFEVPESTSRRFARLPKATLEFGSFLYDLQTEGTSGIFVSGSTPLTAAWPGRPAWAPNGRRVAFAQARRGRVHLFSLRSSLRGKQVQLTTSPGRDLNPRWSPDGRTIVFERHVAGGADLYSIRPDGSGLRRVTYWQGRELSPDYSPDGASIVFTSDASGRFQLYVMPVGGSLPRRLTDTFGDDRRPVWSPDGRWIAFSSDRDGDDDVYLTDPDGRGERKLTHNASQDLVQDWQPLHDALAPKLRALPSSSPRGRAPQLRYELGDESPYVRIAGDVSVGSFDQGRVAVAAIGRKIESTVGRRMHVLAVPLRVVAQLADETDSGSELPSRFGFCLTAVDPWGNASSRNCSTFRFR